jgi:hypothetical protein
MSLRSAPPKPFYANVHDAAADIQARLRDMSGSLAAGEFILLGTDEGATRTAVDNSPNGTDVYVTTRSIRNLVVVNAEDPTSTDVLHVADSVAHAVGAPGYGVGVVYARVPRYTASDEAQKVIHNPGAGAVAFSLTWEETAKPGFANGVHPGNGVFTLPLGTIDPTGYDADSAPIRFHIAPEKRVRIDSLKVLAEDTVIIVTGGTALLTLNKTGGTALTQAPVDLETLVLGTLTPVTLAASEATRTVEHNQGLFVTVALSAFAGTPSDVTVELTYTLL